MSELTTMQIGQRLVELCNADKSEQVVQEFYADNIVSEEAISGGDMPRVVEGLDAIQKKFEWWETNFEYHGGSTMGPFPNGDQFVVIFDMDVTHKTGPMAGQRMQMQEAAVYTVKDGKIVHEKFFYGMDE